MSLVTGFRLALGMLDAEDARPAATMEAYCAAVGLPFNPRALTWERGE